MNKPYVYIDRYSRAGFLKPFTRLIPRTIGSHVRAAFHGIGDGSRSLEVYVQPNGWWSVETGPGPVSMGERTRLVSGRLPGEWGPEEFRTEAMQYAVIGINHEDSSRWILLCATEADAERLSAVDSDSRSVIPVRTMRPDEVEAEIAGLSGSEVEA